jgi:hypothetical protein
MGATPTRAELLTVRSDLEGYLPSSRTIDNYIDEALAQVKRDLEDRRGILWKRLYPEPALVNAKFLYDASWTKDTGVDIASGLATWDGTAGQVDLSQAVGFTDAQEYTITYTVSGYSSGTISVLCGSTGTGTARSANGTYTETIQCSGDTDLYFRGASFNGSIDNVSITFDGSYLENTDGTGRNEDRCKHAIKLKVVELIFKDYAIDASEGAKWWEIAQAYKDEYDEHINNARLDVDLDDDGAIEDDEEMETGQTFFSR